MSTPEEPLSAQLARLRTKRDKAESVIRSAKVEIGRLNQAIAALEMLTQTHESPKGTQAIILEFVSTLAPGERIDIRKLVKYADVNLWQTAAIDRRCALIGRLSKMASEGKINKTGRAEYYKRA